MYYEQTTLKSKHVFYANRKEQSNDFSWKYDFYMYKNLNFWNT